MRQRLHIVARRADGRLGLAADGWPVRDWTYQQVATVPPIYPEWLGDQTVTADHGVRFPYVAGEMANGLATTAMVAAMARGPLVSLLPAIMALRRELARRLELARPVRVGAAGGLGDPAGVAAAFAPGAAYVLTGSLNQMAVEAAVSAAAKSLLSRASVSDVAMAPLPDMFAFGVKVRCCAAARCSPAERRRSSASTASTHRSRPSRREREMRWNGRSWGARSTMSGRRHATSGRGETPLSSLAPKRTPSTAWRLCSGGTSASRAGGRSMATRPGKPTVHPWTVELDDLRTARCSGAVQRLEVTRGNATTRVRDRV